MSQCSKAERDKEEAKDRKTKNGNRNKKESNLSLKNFFNFFFFRKHKFNLQERREKKYI